MRENKHFVALHSMRHPIIQQLTQIFHEKGSNIQLVEQTKAQILKDCEGLCEIHAISIDYEADILEQFKNWLLTILIQLEKNGNAKTQFLYKVDLPEKQANLSDTALAEAILFREAQKVYFRLMYKGN